MEELSYAKKGTIETTLEGKQDPVLVVDSQSNGGGGSGNNRLNYPGARSKGSQGGRKMRNRKYLRNEGFESKQRGRPGTIHAGFCKGPQTGRK